jgi:hypothetical protein
MITVNNHRLIEGFEIKPQEKEQHGIRIPELLLRAPAAYI